MIEPDQSFLSLMTDWFGLTRDNDSSSSSSSSRLQTYTDDMRHYTTTAAAAAQQGTCSLVARTHSQVYAHRRMFICIYTYRYMYACIFVTTCKFVASGDARHLIAVDVHLVSAACVTLYTEKEMLLRLQKLLLKDTGTRVHLQLHVHVCTCRCLVLMCDIHVHVCLRSYTCVMLLTL